MEDRPDLDRRVAEAAEAWLTDPRDTGVYARLVAAVAERRAWLDLRPDAAAVADVVPAAAPPDAALVDDALPDDEAEPEDAGPPLRPVGVDLTGDPRAVLERLRRP